MQNDQLRLRTIMVSGRSALKQTGDSRQQERIRGRMVHLLASLEESVRRDGADPGVLAAIRRMRREVGP
jgi:hypothetical protein